MNNINLFYAILGGAITIFLGLLVFLHNRHGAANAIFIFQSLVGGVWAVVNYFSVVAPPGSALFWIRLVIFFAVPYVFLFFLFVQNFPENKFIEKKFSFWGTLACMILMMALAISPFVFTAINIVNGGIFPVPGPLIVVFAPILVLFFLLTTVQVFRKFFQKDKILRKQWIAIGSGFLIAYFLLIFLVFLRVVVFNDTTFVPYSALFIIPIFMGAAYAILREHLFNVKVVAAEVMTFFLLFASFIEVLNAQGDFGVIIGLFVVVFTIIFGTLLIQSVLHEVQQREELEKLDKELQQKNVQLDELSHFKSELLSLASHQIRSPLAAIKGFGTLIVGGSYGPVPDVIKSKVEQMDKSADSLIGLINTLLDVRKVEEGKMDYQMARTDLNKIVHDVVDLLKPLAETKKLEFKFDSPGHEVPVNADAEKLKQVVQNLTDNAIKYTPNGFVHVELKEEPPTAPGQAPTAIVTVSDSGVGFSPNLAPHLFEEFIRDERVKKQILGTGLGLYIARKIAEAHGGTVWAESAGEGKGSAFHVKVPEVK